MFVGFSRAKTVFRLKCTTVLDFRGRSCKPKVCDPQLQWWSSCRGYKYATGGRVAQSPLLVSWTGREFTDWRSPWIQRKTVALRLKEMDVHPRRLTESVLHLIISQISNVSRTQGGRLLTAQDTRQCFHFLLPVGGGDHWTGRTGCWLPMNRLSWRNNRLKLKTLGQLPIILEEFIEYTPHLAKKTERCQHVTGRAWKHSDLDSLFSLHTDGDEGGGNCVIRAHFPIIQHKGLAILWSAE